MTKNHQVDIFWLGNYTHIKFSHSLLIIFQLTYSYCQQNNLQDQKQDESGQHKNKQHDIYLLISCPN
jgi:hypothetical protein